MRSDMLSKIATVVPVAHLEEIANDRYFMALTHLADDPAYMQFYQQRIAEGKYVILDNSTVELGHPEERAAYLRKAVEMGASEMLAPDWLHDAHRTLTELETFLIAAHAAGYRGSIMAVPQGRDDAEWRGCAKQMLCHPINTLGISRRYTQFSGLRRHEAILNLWEEISRSDRREVRIHLLGCAGRPETDVAPSLILPCVQGVDSSLASVFTAAGLRMDYGVDRPSTFVNFEDRYDVSLLRENIAQWKRLCSLFHWERTL